MAATNARIDVVPFGRLAVVADLAPDPAPADAPVLVVVAGLAALVAVVVLVVVVVARRRGGGPPGDGTRAGGRDPDRP